MISVCVPTRGRPDRFRQMVESAFANADGQLQIVARLDLDDPDRDRYPDDERITYVTGIRPHNMSSLWNECWEHADGDIGMLAGDDVIFETPSWDTHITEVFEAVPDRLVMVYGNDGTVSHRPVLPFISRRWADLAGFTTNDFPGWMADEWIWSIAAELQRVVFLEHVMTRHHQLGNDRTYTDAAMRRMNEGGLDGLRRRFYSPELVGRRDFLVESLRSAMSVPDLRLVPDPVPPWYQQSLEWAEASRPRIEIGRDRTLVVLHCWAGDSDNVRDFLPYHKRHGCPVLVLSPTDSPVIVEDPSVMCHQAGLRAYFGQISLDRQREHLEYLLTLDHDYFLLNDADSICLSPEIPEYLYRPEHREVIWSNEVREARPHRSPYPKIAMQPPYFCHRDVIEKLLTVNVPAHPITPYIDWYMLALAEEAGVPHRSFPDGASFPAWRRNRIVETQQLGHDFKHEYEEHGMIAGDALMLRKVREGKVFIHSVKHRPVMDKLIEQHDRKVGHPPGVVERKLTVSVLVPFRPEPGDETRTRAWEWIEKRWRWLLPEAEIIEGHDDGEPFSKTTAVNDAFLRSTGDILIMCDADTWLERDRLVRTISMVEQKQRLVVPWSQVKRLDEESTKMILMQDPESELDLSSLVIERGSPAPVTAGTICAITRSGFEKVNGMDPRFRGWGFEDISFRRACDVLLGKTTYLHLGVAYSLWHPSPTKPKRGRVWGDGDEGLMNNELNGQYLQAERQPMIAMRMLCDQHPLGQPAEPIKPRYATPRLAGGDPRAGGSPATDGEFVVREKIFEF